MIGIKISSVIKSDCVIRKVVSLVHACKSSLKLNPPISEHRVKLIEFVYGDMIPCEIVESDNNLLLRRKVRNIIFFENNHFATVFLRIKLSPVSSKTFLSSK